MSHPAQMQFVASVRERFPDAFTGKRVLEIGSFFVNGSVRQFFTDCDYVGADVGPGYCVDLVCPDGYAAWARQHQPSYAFDTVISAECLEHCESWRETLAEAVRALKPGGLLILTVAGRARQEHGTRRTSPQDSLLQTDYYMGLDEADLRHALRVSEFSDYEFSSCLAPSDTYFWGVKNG